MRTNHKSVVRWPLFVSCLAILGFVLACVSSGPEPTSGPDLATLRLAEGAIEGQDVNGEWVPVAGQATFEITGTITSINPWEMGGVTFIARESGEIEAGLETGNLVKAKGMILEDGTWVALSIARTEAETAPTITLIGKATSMDPWAVNGITLNVTEDTLITGEIAEGMLVRVEILLAEDGTWEVLSIAPLGVIPEEEGCVTVLATIVNVDGNVVQFEGWPAEVTIEGEVDTGTLATGQTVTAVLCSVDGQVVITQITVLDSEDGDEATSPGQEKVLVCHKPDKKGGHTISIAEPAVPAHLAHGDTLGACP